MVYFYAEVLPAVGAVRLVLDLRTTTEDLPAGVQVRRFLVDPATNPGAAYAVVRPGPHLHTYGLVDGGAPVEAINGGVRVWYDTEAPLDVPVWYRVELYDIGGDNAGGEYGELATDDDAGGGFGVMSLPTLDYLDAAALVVLDDATFAAGVDGWSALPNATVDQVPGIVPAGHGGVGSLRLTSGGGQPLQGAASPVVEPVLPDRQYIVDAWLMAPAGASDARLAIDWYDAGAVNTSSSVELARGLPAGVWAYRRFVATAPADAVGLRGRLRWGATPAAGALLYAHRVRLLDPGPGWTAAAGSPVVVPSGGGGWLRDPLTPTLDVRLSMLPDDECAVDELPSGVIFAAYSAEQRAGASARYDVVDQAEATVATSVRKAPTATLTLATLTFADRDRLHELLASGRVLLLQLPPAYGLPDRYLDVADVGTTPLVSDLRTQYRVVDLPHAVVLAPGGPAEAPVGYRWVDQCGRYSTWDEIDAAQITGLDVLLGAASAGGTL